MALESHERCLLANKERHSSFPVAHDEMQRKSRALTHDSLTAVLCRHQRLFPPLLAQTDKAQPQVGTRLSAIRVATPRTTLERPESCKTSRPQLS